VVEEDSRVVGFYGLGVEGHEAELAFMFVEPEAIGRGFGTRLWHHAVHTAKTLGCGKLFVESDPFAEAFYHAMGAKRVGEAPSEAVEGRMLPLLVYPLTSP
jgi:N-acetylglutamate synthase-like GNAT family acetyltransferase